jgi:uncharacterized protein (TIGR00299 family) protein
MPRRSSTDSTEVGRGKAGGRRVLHLDPFSGIAGNMFVAALLDLGLSRKALDADLAGLGVEFKLKVSRVKRGALAARYMDVVVPGRRKRKPKAAARRADGHGAEHGHSHPDLHSHPHPHAHGPHDAHAHAHGRSHGEIVALLEGASLDASIRTRALAIFEALGRAEAKVHGVPLADVHFHEVGAVDAIVDVTAAAAGIERLGIERVTCAPIALGHGTVETDHGLLPLPAPATLQLLAGMPTVPAHVAWETVTPTGAAIARVLVDEFTTLPAMHIEAIGHGAGNDRPGPMPNLLRAVIGRESAGFEQDRICCLETNLDDLVPEHFDYLLERLMEAGALDVSIQHIQMKKNRPGFLVRVLAQPSHRHALATILFAESTAIGVRSSEWDRLILKRTSSRVDTPYGRIRVKIVEGVDGRRDCSAEYDDCKRAARKHAVPLREVVLMAETVAREGLA